MDREVIDPDRAFHLALRLRIKLEKPLVLQGRVGLYALLGHNGEPGW